MNSKTITYRVANDDQWYVCETLADLKRLPNYDEIVTIYCPNQLAEVQPLPQKLTILQCFENGRWVSAVPYLPELPTPKMKQLYCCHNMITKLPPLSMAYGVNN